MSEQLGLSRAPARGPGRTTSADLVAALEERTLQLVERCREARRTIQELRAQLKERDKRMGELNEKVYALGRVRGDARRRVEKLIGELDRLERGAREKRARSSK